MITDRLKGVADRLHDRRQSGDNRAYDEAGEGESQRACAPEARDPTAWAVRPERNEDIEAENRWRQHQWKRDNGCDELLCPHLGTGKPPSQRRGNNEESKRGNAGQL